MNEKIAVSATIGETNYITKLSVGKFSLQADEPEDLGGADTAPTPFKYLYSALASCVSITLKMYTQHKGWDVGEISVNIIPYENEDGETILVKQLSTEKEITEDQQKRLLKVADKCPVAKMLKNGVAQEVRF